MAGERQRAAKEGRLPAEAEAEGNMPKITEEFARKAAQPEPGQKLIFDDKIAGFGLRLTAGSRAWIVQVRENRKSKRMTLGRVGERSLASAKREASALK